ncbi:t-SNARE [Melampsora americana]|nr:t-SNARE [Melampsora americana]
MSFNDLERGLNEHAPLAKDSPFSQDPERDRRFQALATKVSTHIFRINSNVSGLQKFIDLLGSSRDTADIRKKLHDLTESTREFVKNSSVDAKELAVWQVPEQFKMEQQKVSRDYANSIQAFQRVSRLSAERQKEFVDRAKYAALPMPSSPTRIAADDDSVELSETRIGQQQQQLHASHQLNQEELIPDHELDYQDALIEEREAEIREIETGIHELNEIFRDLGTIVQEQGGHIDNIESNVHSISNDMRGAVVELHQAHDYQRKAGKRMLCLLLIFIIVLAIVLIAILI